MASEFTARIRAELEKSSLSSISKQIESIGKDKLKETSKVSCKVNLKKGCELGDVNMDTKISLVDATYILQYYNGVRELSDEQKALANVNKDGDINLVDVLLILKYCNGERGSF